MARVLRVGLSSRQCAFVVAALSVLLFGLESKTTATIVCSAFEVAIFPTTGTTTNVMVSGRSTINVGAGAGCQSTTTAIADDQAVDAGQDDDQINGRESGRLPSI